MVSMNLFFFAFRSQATGRDGRKAMKKEDKDDKDKKDDDDEWGHKGCPFGVGAQPPRWAAA